MKFRRATRQIADLCGAMSALALISSASPPGADSQDGSAVGPFLTQAVSKRLLFFLGDAPVGLDDLSGRVSRFWGFLRLVRAYGPDFAVLSGDLAGYGRKLKPASAYAALIASISGLMPMVFMTRLRL